jgi:serine/threonine protein kinase
VIQKKTLTEKEAAMIMK